MGVAVDQFVRDRAGNIVEGKIVLLLGHARMEDHLQQQVAELVAQRGHVAAIYGVGDLVGFFDGVGDDGLERLLDIPRTPFRRVAQSSHDVDQFVDVGGWHLSRSLSSSGTGRLVNSAR